MKIKLLALALVVFFMVNSATAQEQGDISLHGGTSFVFSPFGGDGTVGFGGGAEYAFTDGMSAYIDYMTYSPDGGKYNVFSVDYRYYFMTDDFQVYGSAGYASVAIKPDGGTSISGGSFALGVGALYPVSDNFGITAAFKYNLTQLETATATGTETKMFGALLNVGIAYKF
jgi:opacity protein-like surface antigen